VRGDVYFHKGDYRNAVDDYTRGLAKKPNIEAYEKLGESEKALADYKAVLNNAPTHKGAMHGSARLGQQDN
jgi:tetratricopeptide (TPR) repeat protein